jgi:hypothetical protein
MWYLNDVLEDIMNANFLKSNIYWNSKHAELDISKYLL